MGEDKKKKAGSNGKFLEEKVSRRDFVVKGGKYAFVTATAMKVLLTSKRAMAQSGNARFVITPQYPTVGFGFGTFSGIPARSPSATWIGNAPAVAYNYYTIEFEGNTAALPSTVRVRAVWTAGTIDIFYMGDTNNTTGWFEVDVPKTGGSIGIGGSVIDTSTLVGEKRRPYAENTALNNTESGSVVFSATGVDRLDLIVQVPPGP